MDFLHTPKRYVGKLAGRERAPDTWVLAAIDLENRNAAKAHLLCQGYLIFDSARIAPPYDAIGGRNRVCELGSRSWRVDEAQFAGGISGRCQMQIGSEGYGI